jgi:Protein of unknown function (DUF3972)
MASLMKLSDFASMSGKDEASILQMCADGELGFEDREDGVYIDAAQSTKVAIHDGARLPDLGAVPSVDFVEKTIGTIVAFHEKVVAAKDETIDAIKRENKFLKEGLLSMQDIYDTDKDTITTLAAQLKIAQADLDFMKRKYKLMWGQVIEKHAPVS